MKPHPRVLLTKLGDESGVLLHLDTKNYYTLNPTGVFAWERMVERGVADADALVDDLLEAFEVDREQAASDVRTLLDELTSEGLIEASDEE